MSCSARAAVLAVLAVLLAGACGGEIRHFKDQPVVWKVNDARDTPQPEVEPWRPILYFSDVLVMRRLTYALELKVTQPARNTNSLDEVPDSTWFTNRIGIRLPTPADAAAGPGGAPPSPPFRVTRGKSEGGNPGFFMKDATDRTFLVKFDTVDNPEMQTTASVVVGRFLWGVGYNVPSDSVFIFKRDDLTIDKEAKVSDPQGHKRPMTEKDLDTVLATSPKTTDGAYRASSSELLAGTPLGGLRPEGLRPDDPNDLVPHEHRRELRGLRVFAAWLGHSDVKGDNFLDMYVKTPGGGHVVHYLVDFGEAMGGHQAEKNRLEDGYEYIVDWEMQVESFFALGLWKRPWEGQTLTPWKSIGYFGATHFDPRGWREAYPFWPFFEMDATDAYWAAKLVMRFDRPMIQAIVAQGRLSEPAAAAYLVDTLVLRRDKIGRVFLDAVTSLDDLTVSADRLCGVDLVARHGLGPPATLELLDDDDLILSQIPVAADGAVCLSVTGKGDDYTVLRVRFRRGGDAKPVMQVHYKGGANPRILGIVRVED